MKKFIIKFKNWFIGLFIIASVSAVGLLGVENNESQIKYGIIDFENKIKAEQQEYFSKNGEYKTIEETTEGNIKYRVDRYISWLGGEVVGVGYQIYTEKDGFKKSTGEGHLKETLDYDFKEIQIIKPEIREYIATTTK